MSHININGKLSPSDLVSVTLFRSKAAALAYDMRMRMMHVARDVKTIL